MEIPFNDVLFLSTEAFEFDKKTFHNARFIFNGRVLRLKSNAELYELYKDVKEVRVNLVAVLGVYDEAATLTLKSLSAL